MIAVTGAAGFIGSCVVWRLNQLGEQDILCVDTHARGDDCANLTPLTYRGYVGHDEFLARLRGGSWRGELDCVLHLGACSSTTEGDWAYLERNNVGYSRDLCELTLERGARFVHAGSAATYGDGSRGNGDDHATLRRLEPLNLYARSKHMFDLWALDRGLLDEIVVLKYFNVYGPNEWHKGPMRSMVCKGYEQIRKTGRVQLFKSARAGYPDGGQRRDFIYVKDVVDITLWFRGQPRIGGVFNVGTGRAETWNHLVLATFRALGREPRIEYVDIPPAIERCYQYETRADVTKLRAAGCPMRITSLDDAVSDYVLGYLVTGRHLGEES